MQTGLLREVKDALHHLYDFAYLEAHPLAFRYWPENAPGSPGRARRLHDLLVDCIEELQPVEGSSHDTLQARSRSLLLYRFVEEWPVAEVMHELGYSRRQFFREQHTALALLADVLSARLPQAPAAATGPDDPLAAEAVRILPEQEAMDPGDVALGAIHAVHKLAELHGVELSHDLETPSRAYGNRTLLRQVLIRGLSHLIAHAGARSISLRVQQCGGRLAVELGASGGATDSQAGRVEPPSAAALQELRRLVEMMGGQWQGVRACAGRCWLRFALAIEGASVILVVEDNEAVVRAFSRYVAGTRHQVVGATTSAEAMRLAAELHPFAITLDIMMPGQDGWETLQALKNEPRTREIPVLICSALGDPDLAGSLGAAAYLKKPVSQADLLAALAALSARS